MSAPDVSDVDDESVVDAVDLTEDHEWQDAENDEEQLTFVSLRDDETFPSLQGMLEHCNKQHGLDLAAVVRELGVYVSLTNHVSDVEADAGSQHLTICQLSSW